MNTISGLLSTLQSSCLALLYYARIIGWPSILILSCGKSLCPSLAHRLRFDVSASGSQKMKSYASVVAAMRKSVLIVVGDKSPLTMCGVANGLLNELTSF